MWPGRIVNFLFFLFQCMICLQGPRASLGSLFAAGLKTPRSCRSALWTAVLASSPPSILKAKHSPASTPTGTQNLFVACHLLFSYSPRLHGKDVRLVSGTRRVRCVSGRQDWSEPGLAQGLPLLLLLSGFAGNQRTVFSKGI